VITYLLGIFNREVKKVEEGKKKRGFLTKILFGFFGLAVFLLYSYPRVKFSVAGGDV
jgi:hypothetical protein